jgi:hypothetical protein
MLSEETVWGLRQMVPGALLFGLAFVLDYRGIVSGSILVPFVMGGYVLMLLSSMLYTVHSYKPPYGVRTYSVTGGVYTGRSMWFGAHASWPFARLYATADEITIVAPWRTYAFKKGAVTVERYGFVMKTGLSFAHRRPDYPKLIAFFPGMSSLAVSGSQKELRSLGFNIKE